MDSYIIPGKLSGTIRAIPSKSQAHRFLICAALSKKCISIICPSSSLDIDATVSCLNAMGADITKTEYGFHVKPITSIPDTARLYCGESGSTLRFLLPIAGALGIHAEFCMEGRLSQRPLSPLWEEMERMGCSLSKPDENTLLCQGRLREGSYSIAGNVSSQFVSGLLFALPLLSEHSKLEILGELESAPYVDMTRAAITAFSQEHIPDKITVEGDWSSAACFLAAKKLGSDIRVTGLCDTSLQADRQIVALLDNFTALKEISAKNIPDLVPVLAVVAAAGQGTVITDIARLRTKESDRVRSVQEMICSLGGQISVSDNTMYIRGTGLKGGCVNSFGDHRIAMAAAIASTVCSAPVTVLNAECVSKSYPSFWKDFSEAGGQYEFKLR